jgi:hypothetical protein
MFIYNKTPTAIHILLLPQLSVSQPSCLEGKEADIMSSEDRVKCKESKPHFHLVGTKKKSLFLMFED